MNLGGSDSAVAAARNEASQWMEIATAWDADLHPEVWADRPATEASVVGHFDPADDLNRRAESWQYEIKRGDLADLCRFAAGLAVAEADAWRDDQPHIATRAFADRRFLISDRILHWAVPWLDAVGRCYPSERAAHDARDTLLLLADHHRPAPGLVTGTEGLYPPGHDAFGPVDAGVDLADSLRSLWSGMVLLEATLNTLRPGRASGPLRPDEVEEPALRRDLGLLYEITHARWMRMGRDHPGSERIWQDLAARADRTSRMLFNVAA